MNLYFKLAVFLIGVILTLSLGPSSSTSSSNSDHFPTGTVLFHNKKCWQHEDLALLSSRKTVQNLIPTNELDVSNDGYITNVIDYFRMCFSTTQKMSSGRSQDILLLALADAIGGYLHYYVLPVTKEAFYCGNIRYDRASMLFSFYEEIKAHLDTNGKRWATPMDTCNMDFKTRALTVAPPSQDQDPCAALLFNGKHYRDSRECTSATRPSPIPMPFLDDAEAPTSIAVPFRESKLLPLTSPRAAFVLEKYYVAGVQCLMSRGGEDSREDLAAFDTHLYRWLEQSVVPLLKADQWYPAFGGVRKILKTIKSSGHGDSSLDSEMPSTSGQQGASLDSDVHDVVDAGGSAVATWSLYAAVGLLVLVAWMVSYFILYFVISACKRRLEDRGYGRSSRGSDDQYQLINTFVQIFYDKQDCGTGKKPVKDHSDSADSSGTEHRLSITRDGRSQSIVGTDRHQSKEGQNHRKSTSGPDRRQSTARNNAPHSTTDHEEHEEDHRHSTSGHDRRQSTMTPDRRQSAAKNSLSHSTTEFEDQDEDRRHSTPGHDRRQSTMTPDRRQSVSKSNLSLSNMDLDDQEERRQSTSGHDRRKSTPAPDRRQSVARNHSSHSTMDIEDHDEEQENEHSPIPNKPEPRRRTGSIFGRSRVDSTTLEQVQTKHANSGNSRRKKRGVENTESPSLPTKNNRGKMPFSADSSMNNSVDSLASRATTGSEELSLTDYTSSEEGQFINNGSK